MARVALGFAVLGLLIIVVGFAVFTFVLPDRFFALAVLIVGAFLIILPYTRPHIDDE